MAKLTDVTVTFKIEPIVKIKCQNWDCRNHIKTEEGEETYPKYGFCNLKHITIGRDVDNLTAFCENRETKQ